MNELREKQLKEKAAQVRQDIILSVSAAKSGHPGGSLSAADIVTYLYFEAMNIDPKNPKKRDRDRFVLSKGHGAPALYGALAEKGFFPKSELLKLRQMGAMLQGHPDMKSIPGVDMSTGSLGQGLSVANGMALAAKYDKDDYKIYVLMGDGELQEGQNWEAAMSAAHYKLNNIIAFIDYNGLQIDGKNSEVITVAPLGDKWRAFGWQVIEIDGHSFNEIDGAVREAKKSEDRPTVVIAKTLKGKGVSFMENQVSWHGSAPNEEQTALALKELEVIK